MKNNFKEKIISLFPNVWILKRKLQHKMQFQKWDPRIDSGPAPHIYKQKEIAFYQKKYGYNIFLETGTFLGDMLEANKDKFEMLISIELGLDLFSYSQNRFRNNNRVKIINGDSGKILPQVLADFVKKPAVIWLDGHYSGGITAKGETECPIMSELNAIFNSTSLPHVILIDDARCFSGEGDYPHIDSLIHFIKGKNENYNIEIKQDIIRCTI